MFVLCCARSSVKGFVRENKPGDRCKHSAEAVATSASRISSRFHFTISSMLGNAAPENVARGSQIFAVISQKGLLIRPSSVVFCGILQQREPDNPSTEVKYFSLSS